MQALLAETGRTSLLGWGSQLKVSEETSTKLIHGRWMGRWCAGGSQLLGWGSLILPLVQVFSPLATLKLPT